MLTAAHAFTGPARAPAPIPRPNPGLRTHLTTLDFSMDGFRWDREVLVTYEYEPAEGASRSQVLIASVDAYYLAGSVQRSMNILPILPAYIAADLAVWLRKEVEEGHE